MLQQRLVTRAIFPVAGLGTRFLPATKANPKEMLPIVDKPLIQYAVEEAIAAGITELIFVTCSGKRSIEDHFDHNFELETKLFAQGNLAVLEQIQEMIPSHVTCMYVRQSQALGLGHAILQAKKLTHNQPFAVLLADDLIDSNGGASCLQQMLDHYAQVKESIIAVEHVPLAATEKYGIIQIDTPWQGCGKIDGIIEKPTPELAPSQLGVIGRYILEPTIFEYLEQVTPGSGGEIELTDAIALLLETESVHAMEVVGKRYDCGCKLGYLQATIMYALRHPEVKDGLNLFLKALRS
ncbi:MAG: UTP--glucose-1-phosphate uridylyltransferase GalU [Legionellales bacterium]|nr:UTP--glucose-1-phosphate uridylyltransferase GalU [Legionellales bacterium]